MQAIRILAIICLIISSYYFTYHFFQGIQNPIPGLGDSWDYHIPIAKSIIDGSFLNPDYKQVKQYFPGSSEAINSIFILLNIPLTLSNLFAVLILGICCYKLGTVFNLNRYYSLIFSLSIISLNALMRWANAVSIDVWIAVYFILLIILLEKPKKTFWYFLQLGFLSGMMIGSKYNAVIFLAILGLFSFKKIKPVINFQKSLIFLIPFSFFGVFWYIRNFITVQNPFYPLTIFGFPGQENFGGYLSGNYSIINIGIRYPYEMINAAFGEYNLWLLSVPIAMYVVIKKFIIKKDFSMDNITKIFLLGLIVFLFFLKFPTDENTWIMVTSFRYSYPAFIPLILGIFLLGAKYKKELHVGIVAIAVMICSQSMTYYPKLIIFYLPLALIFLYFFDKKNFKL